MSEKIFYRYVSKTKHHIYFNVDGDYHDTGMSTPYLELKIYHCFKETPKGFWIVRPYDNNGVNKRWVSNSSAKRFAYPTKAEALESYIKRANRRLKILNGQLKETTVCLEMAKEIKETEPQGPAGRGE